MIIYAEAKRQVLSNLSNFAYDPINFEFLKQLHAIDLFLDQLSSDNEDFLHFGLAALCNISPGLSAHRLMQNLHFLTCRPRKQRLHHQTERHQAHLQPVAPQKRRNRPKRHNNALLLAVPLF
jgi:hypothetical protein